MREIREREIRKRKREERERGREAQLSKTKPGFENLKVPVGKGHLLSWLLFLLMKLKCKLQLKHHVETSNKAKKIPHLLKLVSYPFNE